ncbi:substrate-binding domain-containing protein [Saccharopolyspora sp. HNM0983]|uniref:Substrate-binding domain-containing protein n=1 Tax=Saccharopolyspora montiporae TaxID=2781240 RepID=A0A929G0W9_9PSEU|nr:substrate-binding domain-containing protein [Saccharopolyspora sp. HNM0983]MBE9375232.1 substrate-binding domain-containing protein [Saccharopolyspora sp. HNM0983]
MPRRVAAAALGLLVLLATGCTAQRHWGGNAAGDGEARIGLVTKTDTNPYFVALRDAAERAAQQRGAEFSALAGQFDGDNDGQVRAIENLLQRNVSTILITPNSSTGVLDAIDRARQAGVLVIALDTATEPAEAVDATFATDNREAGRKQGAYVRAALGERRPQLLMLDGTAGSTVDTYRHDGFLDGMRLAPGAPEIRGAQNVNGDQNLAQQGLENLLARTGGINAIYTMNEPTAQGAHTALRAHGTAEEVTMASIDGGCEGVREVAEGRLAATVMQFPAKMAELAVDAAVQHAENGQRPTGFTDTGSVVITDDPVPGVPSNPVSWGRQHCWGDR